MGEIVREWEDENEVKMSEGERRELWYVRSRRDISREYTLRVDAN